jgi:hypothetical protein
MFSSYRGDRDTLTEPQIDSNYLLENFVLKLRFCGKVWQRGILKHVDGKQGVRLPNNTIMPVSSAQTSRHGHMEDFHSDFGNDGKVTFSTLLVHFGFMKNQNRNSPSVSVVHNSSNKIYKYLKFSKLWSVLHINSSRFFFRNSLKIKIFVFFVQREKSGQQKKISSKHLPSCAHFVMTAIVEFEPVWPSLESSISSISHLKLINYSFQLFSLLHNFKDFVAD